MSGVALLSAFAASNRQDLILAGGRIIESVFKGKFREQISTEIKKKIKEGQTDEERLNNEIGSASFLELLRFIDNHPHDPTVLSAIKSIFFSVVSKDSDDIKQAQMYQLMLLAEDLSSMEVLVIQACYNLTQSGNGLIGQGNPGQDWFERVTKQIGFTEKELVGRVEESLIKKGLIEDYLYRDRSGTRPSNSMRLTNLGLKLGSAMSNM